MCARARMCVCVRAHARDKRRYARAGLPSPTTCAHRQAGRKRAGRRRSSGPADRRSADLRTGQRQAAGRQAALRLSGRRRLSDAADPVRRRANLLTRGARAYRAPSATLRGFPPHATIRDFPQGATIATSSTRRKMSLLAVRPDLNIVEIRGNVSTRMQKVADRGELDATILALAGMTRLQFKINPDGTIIGDAVPAGMLASVLDLETMLPCVGQGAIGIETRAGDERIAAIMAKLNHAETFQAVTAERSFLRGMGGGCQSPVGAHAVINGDTISLKAISFRDQTVKRGEASRPVAEAAALGEQIAAQLK